MWKIWNVRLPQSNFTGALFSPENRFSESNNPLNKQNQTFGNHLQSAMKMHQGSERKKLQIKGFLLGASRAHMCYFL